MNPEPFIIDIVGPIGSGKSSIIEGLSESSFLSIKQGEELDLWNYSGTQVPGLFSSFLENGEKDEVLGFQTIVLASFLMRDSKLKKALDEKYANYVWGLNGRRVLPHRYIFAYRERSIEESLEVFLPIQINLKTTDKEVLKSFGTELKKRITPATLTIFLEISPETAYRRCVGRARDGEDSYSLELFRTISTQYGKLQEKLAVETNMVSIDAENNTVAQCVQLIRREINSYTLAHPL